jgi:hypothetical protein
MARKKQKSLTRKEFRKIVEDKLVADGGKFRAGKLKGALKRTARFIANEEGVVVWSRKYVKATINFYLDKKTKVF